MRRLALRLGHPSNHETEALMATSVKGQSPLLTYWLYYAGEPIYAVRLPEGASAQDARCTALQQHRDVPLSYPQAPGDFALMLAHSEVRL